MKKIVIFCVAASALLIVTVIMWGHYNRWEYKKNLINEVIDYQITFQDNNKVIDISQLKDKFVIICFWDDTNNVSKFQKKCDSQFKQDERVRIYSIYCYSENSNNLPSIMSDPLKKNEGNFVSFSLNKKNDLLEKLKINMFPTALVINKGGIIIFRGSYDLAIKYLLGLTYAI